MRTFLLITLILIIVINLFNYNNLEYFTDKDFDNTCANYCDVNNEDYIINNGILIE